MKILISVLALAAIVCGCVEDRTELAAVRDILALAQEDKVRGRLSMTLNGVAEAGLKQGVYFGSPGTRIDADLEFQFEDVVAAPSGTVEQ